MDLNPKLLSVEGDMTQQEKAAGCILFSFYDDCVPYQSEYQLLLLIKAVMFFSFLCLIIEILILTALS